MNTPTAEQLSEPLLPLITAGITTHEEVARLVQLQLQRNAGFPITHSAATRYDVLIGMTNLFKSFNNRSVRDASIL